MVMGKVLYERVRSFVRGFLRSDYLMSGVGDEMLCESVTQENGYV